MADRYWVTGGTGNWNSNTNWSASSGGLSGATVPSAADNVFIDGNSGSGTITINSNANCHSFDTTGSPARTITHSGSRAFTCGGGLSDTTAAVFTLTASITWTAALADLTFDNRSGGITVTTNGVDLSSILSLLFGGAAAQATTTLADNLNLGSSCPVSFSRGTFDLGGNTLTAGSISTTGNTAKTFTITNSIVNCGGNWTMGAANFTLNAAGSTINMTGPSPNFTGDSKTYGVLNISGAGTAVIIDGNTYTTFNRSGTLYSDWLYVGGTITIASGGVLTLQGGSQTEPLRVLSNAKGTARAILFSGSPTINVDFVNFQDITALSTTITGSFLGDCGGNTNITFTAPEIRYWVGGNGNWNDTNEWSVSSGGGGGASMPLPQDSAIFDTNSFSANSQVVTMSVYDYSQIDTSAANNFSHTFDCSVSAQPNLYGDLNLNPVNTTWISVNSTVMAYRGNSTLLSGVTMTTALDIEAPSGTVTLGRDLTLPQSVSISAGTFALGGYNLAATSLAPINSYAKSFTGHASSTLTLSSVGTVLSIGGSGFTGVNVNGTSVIITDTSASSKNLLLSNTASSQTWGNITLPSGNGSLLLTLGLGANATFNDFTVNHTVARQITFQITSSFGTFLINGNFNVTGSAGQNITLVSTGIGTAFTLSKSSGVVACDYLTIRDSIATGGASWYAGANSTNVSGNSGWIFAAAPSFKPKIYMIT